MFCAVHLLIEAKVLMVASGLAKNKPGAEKNKK
jgi:hypothetical protein